MFCQDFQKLQENGLKRLNWTGCRVGLLTPCNEACGQKPYERINQNELLSIWPSNEKQKVWQNGEFETSSISAHKIKQNDLTPTTTCGQSQ